MDRLGADSFVERNLMDMLKPAPRRKFCQAVYEKYGIPIDRTMDVVMFKRPVAECSNFEVFAFINILSKAAVPTYFSEDEIKVASEMTFEEQKTEFSMEFEKMCEISHDQWIGRISVKELMHLRDARMINYKEGQQRVLKKVISGGVETFHINISKKSVSEIEELVRNGLYIPDDITLNLPEGAVFKYIDRSRKLIIESLPEGMFDILDGYHRYIALSNIFNQDPNFDYYMEIRFTNFSEEKAQQFIYQKDQKTRMSKDQSDTFNQNNIENRIINMINQDPNCLLYGKIGRGEQLVNMAYMAKFVKKFFIPSRLTKGNEAALALAVKNTLLTGLNTLLNQYPELLETRWALKETFVVLYIISNENVPSECYGDLAEYLIPHFAGKEVVILAGGYVRQKAVNDANRYTEEWLRNVQHTKKA